jgi:alcohol dehydrogenase class IV
MRPHTLWSEVLEIAIEARECEADLFLTVGGGTLTDGAKATVLVFPARDSQLEWIEGRDG